MPRSTPPFSFPGRSSTYLSIEVDCLKPLDPLGAFLSQHDDPEYSRKAMLSPLCLAAATDEIEVIRFLHRFCEMDAQRDLDLALFLANRQGHTATAALLLEYKANPAQESSPNGMHGAAWRGLESQIYDYVLKHGANPDVTDGSSATPVIYAILGEQDERGAWETIKCLFELGASPLARFGSKSYAEIALEEGKEYLAQKLEELCLSPTIPNSSRESTCAPRGDNDQLLHQPLNLLVVACCQANLSRESTCTVGGADVIQPDNKRPRKGPEADGGANSSRESTCAPGGDNNQPDNKRPQDSEVDGGAKRARVA